MKKMLKWWFGVLSLVLTVAWVAHAQQSNHVSLKGFQPGSDFVPNEILILVNPGGKTLDRPNGTSIEEWIREIKNRINLLGLKLKVKITIDERYTYDLSTGFVDTGMRLLNHPRVCGGTLLTLRTDGAPDDVYALDRIIRAVEDEMVLLTNSFGYQSGEDILKVGPNPGFTKPDSMMQATDESDPVDLTGLSQSARGVKVAILDSGFDTNPLDSLIALNSYILNRFNIKTDFKRPIGIDTTANPPNFTSWNRDDFVSPDPGENGIVGHKHGTPIAQLISGIAVGSEMIPAKVCDQDGLCTGRNVTIGLCYAAYRHAQVVNMSFGGFYDSKLVYEAIQDVLSEGALVVAGSGNSRNLLWNRSPTERSRETSEMRRAGNFTEDALRPESDQLRGWNQPVYPAAWSSGSIAVAAGNVDGIISVGSINSRKDISRFSTMNRSVDVVTYGEKIKILYGTNLGGSFSFVSELRSGTSFSAPIITGIAAVLRSQNPNWTASQVESFIVRAGTQQDYYCFLNPPTGTPPDQNFRNNCVFAGATTPEKYKIPVFRHNIDAIRSLLGR